MNTLPLVCTVLLILGLISYAYLENYKNFSVVKTEYNEYIKEREIAPLNRRQEALFLSTKVPTTPKEKGAKQTRAARARLNLKFILDKKTREAHDAEYKQHRLLLKELIIVLYQHTKFYKEIEEKRPQFIDEILTALVAITNTMEEEIKNIQQVEQFDLKDDTLQAAYYYMLKGTAKKEEEGLAKNNSKEKKQPEQAKNEEQEEDESDEGGGVEDEEEELFSSMEGYASLKDFVHFGNKEKIGIYLAPTELLQAIFGSLDIAKQMIEKREALYTNLKRIGPDIALQEFSQFKIHKKEGIDEKLLDFTVTQTDPSEYR